MEQEKKSLREEIEELKKLSEKNNKKFKLPFKAKVAKSKAKKGYITIAVINENKTVDFIKEPIVDGTILLGGETKSIHSVNVKDVFTYKGKPLIFQAKKKLNPYNPLAGSNETYGQPYVMARMEGDKLKVKKSFGMIGWIIGGIILLVIIYSLITGGI